jgi:hypothetical protein
LTGLAQVVAWPTFGLMLIGVAIGFAVGILPGLGGPTTLALMLPFVLKMTPVEAFAFLLGGLRPGHHHGSRGGSIPRIEWDHPGNARALARRRLDAKCAADGAEAIIHVGEPGAHRPTARVEAGPVVGNAECEGAGVLFHTHDDPGGFARVLPRVLERLEATEVRRRLDGRRVATNRRCLHVDWQHGAASGRGKGFDDALVGE